MTKQERKDTQELLKMSEGIVQLYSELLQEAEYEPSVRKAMEETIAVERRLAKRYKTELREQS